MDGLWGPYKVYRQSHGGLEQYLIVGRTLENVVRSYAGLVGYPRLVPKWAFGYLAGGMKYSMLDDPPAHEALLEFAGKLKEHDIPCSGFQLSSGYTVAESEPKTRNVFTWNRHRFPDPKKFVEDYRLMGLRIIANIKPYVLTNHPEYNKFEEAGALFFDAQTKKTAVARLWSAGGGESGVGSHIDFTSAVGFK
jgi:alpha-glucosidase (family GH31 glycosyl hydrolase)